MFVVYIFVIIYSVCFYGKLTYAQVFSPRCNLYGVWEDILVGRLTKKAGFDYFVCLKQWNIKTTLY